MHKPWVKILTSLSVITWLMLIISLYYVSHKPFSLQSISQLLITTKNLVLSATILTIAGGIGRRLLKSIEINPLSAMALQVGVGLWLLSITALILGATMGFQTPVVVIFLAILVIVFWRDCYAWWQQTAHINQILTSSTRFEKLIGAICLFLFVLTLSVALSPPLKFDSLVYHLYLPKYYLEAGRFVYHPRLLFWGMPQLAEILYTLAMAISSAESAAVLGWFVGLLAVLGLLGYVQERLETTAAWISLLALLSGYTMVILLPTAYIEWFSILFGLGVLVLLDNWQGKNQRSWLVWVGIICGFASGVKYSNGILIIAAIITILIFDLLHRRNLIDLSKDLFYLSVPALLALSPWLVKNIVATGNPLYPFLFPSGAMDIDRLNYYQTPGINNLWELLLVPIQSALRGFEGGIGYNATIGPLLLVLCPLSIIGYRSRPQSQRAIIKIAGIIALTGLGIWMIAGAISGLMIQSRLYFALLPAFALLAGAGFSAVSQIKISTIRLGRIVAALIFFVFLLSSYEITVEILQKDSLKTAFGLKSEKDYLEHNLGWYSPAMQAINELPDGSNVLMLWEPRAYYCQPVCAPDEVLDRWRHDLKRQGDAAEVLDSWREDGFSHLLFYKVGADFIKDQEANNPDPGYTKNDWQQLEELLSSLDTPVDYGGVYQLYTLPR